MAREFLKNCYLDWCNNYITVERYAEDNELTVEQAQSLLALAKKVVDTPHPDS